MHVTLVSQAHDIHHVMWYSFILAESGVAPYHLQLYFYSRNDVILLLEISFVLL